MFQLTDDTVFTNVFDLSSNNIANAKQIKHVVDYLLLGKKLYANEYGNYEYADVQVWGTPKILPLDPNKRYFVLMVDKNRGGSKQYNPLFECWFSNKKRFINGYSGFERIYIGA